MVKSSKKKTKVMVKVKPRKRAPTTMVVAQRSALDFAALEYARLVADPCNAKLVNGIAMGSNGTLVVRLEADEILFSDTSTGGSFFWPCSFNTAFTGSAVTDGTAFTYVENQVTAPGSSFLAANASSARCIAACAQVMYPGTELSRSGVIGMGIVPASAVTVALPTSRGGAGSTTTTQFARQICQFTERTPDTMMEIIWRPGQADGELIDYIALNQANGETAQLLTGHNGILISIAGLPALTGVRVRTVGIFEYTPKLALGVIATVETSSSSNTLNDVLRFLDNGNPNWFINGFKKVAPKLLRAGAAYATGGVSEGILSSLNLGNRMRNSNTIAY
jgi:hypothetical protein